MGYAYLRSGERIDYRQYIESHPHWQKVREARYEFDNGVCVVCHADLHNKRYETHHLSYMRLGAEHLRDVVTLCPACHAMFHRNWAKQTYWKGKEQGHWEVFSLEHTARMCSRFYKEDKYISKNIDGPNLCNTDTDRQYVDRYFKEAKLSRAPMIDPHDLELYVRNKRYELLFEALDRGLSLEEFLDDYYGEKIRGKNPIRREAGQFYTKHTIESMRKHYAENKNINMLMETAEKM